jgi:alginate O-acetyltransferase complex protein AlgI
MLFHTLPFLIFFAVVFPIYWFVPWHRLRMLWLLAASFFFYMSWNPWLITLILFSASLDFCVALWLGRVAAPRRRKMLVALSVTCNLGLLAFFKYTNFFLGTAHTLLRWMHVRYDPTFVNIILPLGISFYTFETISYIVDVYRGRIQAERNLLDYALYIMFFPHLIAGPIVRPGDFLPQVARRKHFSWLRLHAGVQLFLLGLFKKAVLADHLGAVVDPIFKAPGTYATSMLWLAVFGYAAQIFCDFSGYSDMAIGLAHAFGFKLHANFNMPYLASNITEFWRRWHISLSSWLRDYLYIPLGGNRRGRWQTYANLMLTMLLGGLWHGANWTFVFWGFLHGTALAMHRALPKPSWTAAWALQPIGIGATFLTVCLGWVFFRAQTFSDAWLILRHLVRPRGGAALDGATVALALICLALVSTFHGVRQLVPLERLERRLPPVVAGAALGALLLAVLIFQPRVRSAFIYFQF